MSRATRCSKIKLTCVKFQMQCVLKGHPEVGVRSFRKARNSPIFRKFKGWVVDKLISIWLPRFLPSPVDVAAYKSIVATHGQGAGRRRRVEWSWAGPANIQHYWKRLLEIFHLAAQHNCKRDSAPRRWLQLAFLFLEGAANRIKSNNGMFSSNVPLLERETVDLQ